MKNPKGFTIAEVLIVLIIIGIISALMIPAVLRHAAESRYIAGYKKGYHTIVNLIAMDIINGKIGQTPTKDNVAKIFDSIATGIVVKSYANIDSANKYFNSKILMPEDFKSCIVFKNAQNQAMLYPRDSKVGDCAGSNTLTDSTPWIIGDDNISYSITLPETNDCQTKEEINSKTTFSETYNSSCAVVVVDTNGLNNGPNTVEDQLSDNFNNNTKIGQLTGDRFYIFIGKNGATAGSESSVLTGRIIANMK